MKPSSMRNSEFGIRSKKSTIPHSTSRTPHVQVEIGWKGRRRVAYERVTRPVIEAWLKRHGGGLISVWMTSTEQVESFNRKYRGVPKPTAVMSFPQMDSHQPSAYSFQKKTKKGRTLTADSLPLKVYGDIVIAEDAVRRYARIERTTERAILEEFLAHGLRGLLKTTQ